MRSKKNKKKFSFTYIFLVMAVMVMFTQLGWSYYHVDEQYANVRVHSGNTVWEIASVASDGKTDVRNVVYDIVKVNGLSGNEDIYPGQILKVPVNSESLQTLQQRFEVK